MCGSFATQLVFFSETCGQMEVGKSTAFSVSNGVRQGGVLSPVLFTIYMYIIDKLLQDLKQQGIGCFWEQHFAGAYAYADDLVILAPSASALRQMLQSCEVFADSHGLKFNPDKTQFIIFSTLPNANIALLLKFIFVAFLSSFLTK